MKLYFAPRTRATRPRWLLEELEVPYELVSLSLGKGEHKTPDYLAIHPLGRVPALEIDGQVLIESTAIILTLADRYPEKGLAPAPTSPARGLYYQWYSFALANLEPPAADLFDHTIKLPEPERVPQVAASARQRFAEAAVVVERHLADREWLLDEFSAADVLMASLLAWGKFMGLLAGLPNLEAYVARATARPAYRRAMR